MVKCLYCQEPLPESAKECPKCKKGVVRYSPNGRAKYCLLCGNAIYKGCFCVLCSDLIERGKYG